MKAPEEKYKRDYLKEVKHLFPVLRKDEKEYYRGLESYVDEMLSQENVPTPTSLEDYHKIFGEPKSFIQQYYSDLDSDSFQTVIRSRSIMKQCMIGIGVFVGMVSVILSLIVWQEHRSFLRSEIVQKEQISEYNGGKIK